MYMLKTLKSEGQTNNNSLINKNNKEIINL